MLSAKRSTRIPSVLDIGGEGRHARAWNLNPRTLKSLGPECGAPIPRLICGRGERVPLPAGSVDVVIIERTPLRVETLNEIRRIAKPGATVVLRHAPLPWCDPHRLATQMLPGRVARSLTRIGSQTLCQTTIRIQMQQAAKRATS